jgi:hypothetical protein
MEGGCRGRNRPPRFVKNFLGLRLYELGVMKPEKTL